MLAKRFPPAMVFVVALWAVGCQPEEKIVLRTVPRLNDMKRLLAAVIPPVKDPVLQKTWVFKVDGAESEIEPLVEPFNQLIEGLQFVSDDGPPIWLLPPDWTREEPSDKEKELGRVATLHMGPKGTAPRMTVSGLTGEGAASLPHNIARWRVQIGLKDNLGVVDMDDFARPLMVFERRVYIVDMIGPGGHAKPPPPVAPPQPRPPVARAPFKYQAPPTWKEVPPLNQFALLSFLVFDKDQKAEFNVTLLPGAAGGLRENVNRWRKMLGLADLSPAEVSQLPDVKIGTLKGKLVDITGPAAPPQNNRTLGAILMRERDSLFFKMTGPSSLLEQHKPAFETFLKYVSFER